MRMINNLANLHEADPDVVETCILHKTRQECANCIGCGWDMAEAYRRRYVLRHGGLIFRHDGTRGLVLNRVKNSNRPNEK